MPSSLAFDWLLVVSCASSVLLAIVYLFYSNRLLALFVGYLLRLSWWSEGSGRSWVSLESFQVSLLAGRITIKDLRYHTSNQTFRAIKCRITWRYWVWRTRGEFSGPSGEGESKGNTKASTLPCRLQISLEGVEWLFYNRTAAYNDILSQLQRQAKQGAKSSNGHGSPVSAQSHDHTVFASDGGDATSRKSTTASGAAHLYPPSSPTRPVHSRVVRVKDAFVSWFASFKPDFHEILPIDVMALHGAIVCGNPSTPSLFVAKFSAAQGSYGVDASRSIHDKYKTVIDVKFQNVKFDMERNGKYRGSLIQHGKAVSKRLGTNTVNSRLSFSAFTRLWTNQKRRETQRKTEDVHARTQAEQEQEHGDYAVAETILEAPQLELSYYWDEPGIVPSAHQMGSEGLDSHDIGNGDLAPQYGVDIVVHGGTVRYGPWADRQRVELQRLFFPPTYQNAVPTVSLKPGDTRRYTELKVFIELRDTTTFHIPFREPSKDWQFDGVKFPGSTRKKREGGWLEVRAGSNSAITYILPWVATEEGYDAYLKLHLDDVTTLSSVNDIQILTAKSSNFVCKLPTPLRWNDSRQWTFDISFQTPTLYLIRDHINLLTDLGKDWSSGPPADYDRWIPMHYVITTALHDFELNLFLNDHNIITHPHVRDVNTLLTMRGARLNTMAEIPSTVFRPQYTTIPFWVEGPGVTFSLTLPRWNTHSLFATSRIIDFGRLGFLRVDASFLYYSDTRPEHIDQLKLDIFTRGAVFISFGWIIRHLMAVRDNYFGTFTHFSTLSEYVAKRNQNLPVGDPVEWKWREGKSNVFEVSLGVRVEDSVMIMPAGFPGYEYSLDHPTESEPGPISEPKGLGTCAIFFQPELQVQLRTHDYSMGNHAYLTYQMSINISPVTTSVVENVMHNLAYEAYQGLGRQKLHLDGINILANRLFGPQPRTSTYLCLWEFQIGTVTGVASTMELRGLAAALTSFRHNFSDDVNAPASEFAIPIDPDVTFLKFALKSVDMAWMADHTSIHLCLPKGLKLDYNDLAGSHYKKVTEVRVPQGVVRALVCSAMRHESWLEAGSVSLDFGLDLYSCPEGWREAAKVQTTFVATQDALTRRAWFLYENSSVRHGFLAPPTYRFSMFLPRPNLPKQSRPVFVAHRQGTRSSSRKAPMRPVVGTVKDGESDEDEHISEADRDARLAHSRPATPLLFNKDYEDRSMSSSDESDNGDVTSDMSDSDSDGAENDEGNTGSTEPSPRLAHYRNIVRRFESHLSDNSMYPSPSLFTLVRNSVPTLDDPPSKTARTPTFLGPSREVPERAQREDTSSVIRLLRSNFIDMLVTPLCTHVVRRFSEDVFNSNTSIELLVDSLTATYLSDAPSEKSSDASRGILDVEVSNFRLRILQSLMAVNDAVASLEAVSPPSNAPPISPGNSRIVSDVLFSVYDLNTTLSQTSGVSDSSSQDITFRASLSQVKAQLDASVLHTLPQMNRTRKVVPQCIFVMDESKTAYASDNLHMKLGDARVRSWGRESPEMAVATADSLVSMIRETQVAYKDRARHSMARRQCQLWGILRHCKGIRAGDPLAQTQPSFLVQLGRPLRIRHDASWKLFMYLRHCLRYLDPLQRRSLLQMQSAVDASSSYLQMDDICSLLIERLPEWGHELDQKDLELLPFVQICFPSMQPSKEKPRDRKGRQLPALSFHSGTFSLAVFERRTVSDDGFGNTFALGPFHIAYKHRNQKNTTSPGKGSSTGADAAHPELGSSISTCHHVLTTVIEDIHLTIHPTFIIFLQRLLPLHGRYFQQTPVGSMISPPAVGSPHTARIPDDYWECFIEAQMISVHAAVEGMVLEVGLTNASLVMPLLQITPHLRTQPRPQRDISGNCLLKLSQLYTRVRQAQDKADPFRSNGRDILTSLVFSSLIIDISYRLFGGQPPISHGVLTIGSVLLSVPRSALLTYRLIEEWRTQYLPNIHAMTQDLLAELDKRQKAQSLTKRTKPTRMTPFPVVEFQVSVKRVGVSLQVMHGTWFSWDVRAIVVFMRNAAGATRSPHFTFGVQLASQLIQIGAQPDEGEGKAAKTIKLALPSFRTSGSYDGHHLQSHAVIDHFSLTLKPRYMDDILVVQQNLGTHFYDVLDLVAENRRNRPMSKKTAAVHIKYDVAFMLQGFRVGIEGPTTTLDLTSAQMTGTAKNENGLAWDFAVSNLALALSHHSTDPRPRSGFDRKLRSAYMVLDLEASSSPAASPSGSMSSQILRLRVSRMHAVMSPNSIGELGDLIDHVQAEKILRQEQRALELEEMRNKTKRVMRTFEMQKPTASLQRSSSLVDNRTLLINVADIGIAFPLALRDEVEVDAIGSVPAFLMSIKTAAFSVKRYESGQASMGRLSFQFVDQFDQSRPSQFDGDQHQSRNRLLYPGMEAEFQSGTSTVTRQWQIAAYVDGFALDLDPAIVDKVFSLIDVYHKGRERVSRLTAVPEATKQGSEETPIVSVEARYLAIRTSNILVTLVFHTGKLCLRGVQQSDNHIRTSSTAHPDPVGRSAQGTMPAIPDVIQFPTITVWGEYRATPAVSKVSTTQDQEPSILIFRSKVYTTINEIKPSIFSFLIGFTEKIEDRLRQPDVELPTSGLTISSDHSDGSTRDSREFLTPGVLSGIQLSFSLRIDSSRLSLVCGHGLGVVAALHWESGGFLVTLSPKARVAHFAGTVTGLWVDLRHTKHQGGMVQTARVDARNLAFSVSYAHTEDDEGVPAHSVSVVVDTEFGAALRFDRLQDILIFKAIYIDRLPGNVPQPSLKATPPEDKSWEGRIPGLTTVVLVRARHIKLIADLGHNIAVAVINLETLVLRSRIGGSVTDLSLSVAQTNLDLEEDRPLSGYMRLPDFSFATVRRNDVQLGTKDGISKMLDVRLTSGTLDIVLQSERRTLLQYHAKPFDIRIADDWTAIDWNLPPEERTLRLDFSVLGTDILAVANLQTIPKIIILLAKLRSDLQVQQTEARNALTTSSIAQLPKPDNALSEVADAMIRSARSKLADGPAFSYIIVQHMRLRLLSLRVALFKNPNDQEMALFQGRDVHAELQRVVHSLDMPPSRILKLAFSSLYLSKYASLKYRAAGDDLMATSWLDRLLKGASESTIARVPAMNLEMVSDVEYEGPQEVLQYDLAATADERGQTSRSIYVSLNLSLYIWAGALVKGLGVEIDKALMTSGFNKPAARAAAAAIASPPSLPAPGASHDQLKSKSPEAGMVSSAASPSDSISATAKSATSTSPSTPAPETAHGSDARFPRKYHARSETSIDYGTIQQLGEATPDAKAPWLGLKETVPPRVHEYATLPMEVLMKMLLEVYSKQLKMATKKRASADADVRGSTSGNADDG